MTTGQGGTQVVNGRGSEAGSPSAPPASAQGLVHSKITPASSAQAIVMSRPAAVTQVPSSGNTVPLQPGMQLVNVRPNQITTVRGGRSIAPRMILSPQMLPGVRPGQQPVTIQTVQSLPPGTRGHLLVKTETGQFQLLPVNAATNGTPSTTASLTQQNAVYRFQQPQTTIVTNTTTTPSLPQSTNENQATLGASTVGITNTVNTNTIVQNPRMPNPASVPSSQPQGQGGAVGTQTISAESAKNKCKNFLSTLLKLASEQRASVARNVRKLIQGLIDGEVEPEVFTEELQQDLNSSPQPCLVPFLKKTLPFLRVSLANGELSIDGVKPPPLSTVTPVPGQTTVIPTMTIVRPPNQGVPTMGVVGPRPNIVHRPPNNVPPSRLVVVRQNYPPLKPQSMQQVKVGNKIMTMNNRSTGPGGNPTMGSRPPVLGGPNNVILKGSPINTNRVIQAKDRDRKDFNYSNSYSSSGIGDDDINDVALMGGVNLGEESQRILDSTGFVGTQIRSCKDETFLLPTPLQQRVKHMCSKHGLDEPPKEVLALISHATQERIKTLIEKLSIIAEHRLDLMKAEPRYEPTQDVKGQLRFLEELDRLEKKRKDEMEREMLLKAAKSRTKSEDPEQAKLKAKAKEMQRVEMEEMRQRDANLTAHKALQGPKKKPKMENPNDDGTYSGTFTNKPMPLRPRNKRVNARDLMFLMEQEKELNKSSILFKSYLK